MSTTVAKPLRALTGFIVIYGAARIATTAYDFVPVTSRPPTSSVAEMVATKGKRSPVPAPTSTPQAQPTFAQQVLGADVAEATPTFGAPVAKSAGYPVRLSLVPRRTSPVRVTRRSESATSSVPVEYVRQTATSPNPPASAFRSTPASQGPVPQLAVAAQSQPVIPGVGPPARKSAGISGSTWMIARSGSGRRDLASTGTLGGSQVGVRLNVPISHSPAFLTARASGALAQRDREFAVGVGIRGRAVGAIVERRIPIDGRGRGQTAVLVYGGFNEVPLGAGFRLDGYGQAGIVGLSRRDPFADGAVHFEHTLTELGRSRISAGAGVWGAAQPGLARLDVGPQVVARVPIGAFAARVAAEYRVRVAGQARPKSGPSLSLGVDF